MPHTDTPETKTEDRDIDLIWGAPAIAAFIGRSIRTVYYLLENEKIPARRIGGTAKGGGRWVISRRKVAAFLRGEEVQS